jgi:predicted permease
VIQTLLRHHRGYAAFVTLSLSLSVGATLAVFTVVNALWLRPLPFVEADRLVVLVGDGNDTAFGGLELADRWRAFAAVAGQVVTSGSMEALRPRIVLSALGREIETIAVTSQYFRLLGVAVRGREFTRDDNRFGAEPVAIISDALWARVFDRRPDAIGQVVAATPVPLRIVGIAAPGFTGARRGERAEIWIPSNLVPRVAPTGALLEDAVPTIVLARLHPGQTTVEARQRLVQDASSEADRQRRERVHVVPLAHIFGTADTRTLVIAEGRAVRVVGGLAALVLLAGCTTLMALVLVHYERRRRELCVRLALGASRRRLIGELARELAWPAAGGTAGALFVAFVSLRALPSLRLPGGVDLSRLDLSIDWRVLGVALGATLLTLIAAAFVPLVRFTHSRLAGELIAASATPAASSLRLRQVLLALHVAATIVVLAAAGLFVRAVIYGYGVGAGFDVDRTAFVQLQLLPPFIDASTDWSARDAMREARRRRLEDGLRALPGVDMVALGRAPIGPDASALLRMPKVFETGGRERELRVGAMSGGPALLDALGVPLIRGRPLSADDATARPYPVLVTAALARTLWPESDPIGQLMTVTTGGRGGTSTVVGVTADFAFGSLTEVPAGTIVNVSPLGGGGMPTYVVHAARPDLLIDPIRKLARDVVPELPRLVLATGRQLVAEDLGRQRLGAWFFSGFGLIALVLGAGGVFGVVAYLAESRRREFGVRLALGATANDLVRRGVFAGMRPVAAGTAAGLIVAAIVARGFVSVLPGLSTLDPTTYVTVSALMLVGAAAAGLTAAWPLRRATPGDAVRAE